MAQSIADPLAEIINKRKLYKVIGQKKHVFVEGWTTLATMLGALPVEISNVPNEDGSYVAKVELRRTTDQAVLTGASGECGGPNEALWQKRPPYARRSMAATRATGKACRLAFSWIMTLAGYAPTPAEEMDGVNTAGADDVKRATNKRYVTLGNVKIKLAKLIMERDRIEKAMAWAEVCKMEADILRRTYRVEQASELTDAQLAKMVSELEGIADGWAAEKAAADAQEGK
jgi:hypothetical protein